MVGYCLWTERGRLTGRDPGAGPPYVTRSRSGPPYVTRYMPVACAPRMEEGFPEQPVPPLTRLWSICGSENEALTVLGDGIILLRL